MTKIQIIGDEIHCDGELIANFSNRYATGARYRFEQAIKNIHNCGTEQCEDCFDLGREHGFKVGYEQGHDDGHEEGYAEGKENADV